MRKLTFVAVLMFVVGTVTLACAEEAKTGRLSGKWVTKDQGAMAGGFAYFFNAASGPAPSYNRYWRVPDEISDVDKNGNFTGQLLPGKYYLGLIKRVKGHEIGPPNEGDFFFFSMDQKGNPKVYEVKKNGTNKIGTINEAGPFKVERVEGITVIEGTVTSAEGKPVPNMLVFAFVTPAMVGRPLYVSDRTGADGKFQLRVKDGGTYYLKTRENYGGGQPVVGEMVGGYLQEAPTPVKVKTAGTTTGIDLKAARFVGRGPKRKAP